MTEQKKSLLVSMASKFEMETHQFANTIKATCLPKEATDEQFAAFLMVAKEHNLNPLTKEIYAFPGKGGGIQPIVGVDGWAKIMNSHPQFDGIDFHYSNDDAGHLQAVTARIHRKDREHPIEVTEYMSECKRVNETWKQWPARMLRHKAMIQCCRIAFGFTNIVDPDEYDRQRQADVIEIRPEVDDLNEKIKQAAKSC
jgi:phage recombination protein Bet